MGWKGGDCPKENVEKKILDLKEHISLCCMYYYNISFCVVISFCLTVQSPQPVCLYVHPV